MLCCSKATITRYMEFLESKYPESLRREKIGKSVYYSFVDKRAKTATCLLTGEELSLLELCKNHTSHMPKSEQDKLCLALDKIMTIFQENTADSDNICQQVPFLNNLKGKILYAEQNNHFENLTKIIKYIKQKRVCYVEHLSGKESEVAFVALVTSNDAIYVQGYFVTKTGTPEATEPFIFYLHRIKNVTSTKRKHALEANNDFNSVFGLMGEDVFKVTVQAYSYAVNYLQDRIYSSDQTIEEQEDGSIILTFSARSRHEVISWVLGFGSQLVLLEPDDLKKEIRKTLKLMQCNYKL